MKIRIEATARGIGSRIWADDQEIKDLKSFAVEVTQRGTFVRLEFVASEVHIEGEAAELVRGDQDA